VNAPAFILTVVVILVAAAIIEVLFPGDRR
jgi:hypothetical protein